MSSLSLHSAQALVKKEEPVIRIKNEESDHVASYDNGPAPTHHRFVPADDKALVEREPSVPVKREPSVPAPATALSAEALLIHDTITAPNADSRGFAYEGATDGDSVPPSLSGTNSTYAPANGSVRAVSPAPAPLAVANAPNVVPHAPPAVPQAPQVVPQVPQRVVPAAAAAHVRAVVHLLDRMSEQFCTAVLADQVASPHLRAIIMALATDIRQSNEAQGLPPSAGVAPPTAGPMPMAGPMAGAYLPPQNYGIVPHAPGQAHEGQAGEPHHDAAQRRADDRRRRREVSQQRVVGVHGGSRARVAVARGQVARGISDQLLRLHNDSFPVVPPLDDPSIIAECASAVPNEA
ncbi:hypothetical protein BD626DRAFT_634309 [Schizophyllum amplum]|uniref:Uncharacterized protein n=1 Tax=Schizophyllum amplum TaxID=97359 RepID=A0A550BZU8_9AGAR|nr:hypothetical protein BD626DRAFT_634309 [Auriculariopsis ampla]